MARYYYKKKKKKFVPKDLASLKELKIKTALMESIPEDITQLYPEARNINRHFILHIGETNTGKTHDALEDFYNADAGNCRNIKCRKSTKERWKRESIRRPLQSSYAIV